MFKYFIPIILLNLTYGNEIIECKVIDSYQNIDTNLEGIELWIDSVKNVDKCDKEQIIYLSGNRNINIILSSVTTLKAKYSYCEQVLTIDKNFKKSYDKILKLKREVNNCSKTKKILDLESKLKNFLQNQSVIYDTLNTNSQKIKDLQNESINLKNKLKISEQGSLEIKKEIIKEEKELKLRKSYE